jgi:hypothetical protein
MYDARRSIFGQVRLVMTMFAKVQKPYLVIKILTLLLNVVGEKVGNFICACAPLSK